MSSSPSSPASNNRWSEAWEAGRTGWDLGGPTPALTALLAAPPAGVVLPDSGAALVPGCGAGYDVRALATALPGLDVVGVDVAPLAKDAFDSRVNGGAERVENAQVVLGDVFAVGSADAPKGVPDALQVASKTALVYDYTFLCAIEPEDRARWAALMARVLEPGRGRLVVLIFPTEEPGRGPPPYQIVPDDVEALLTPHGFECEHLAPVPHDVTEAEWRKGKEVMSVWKLRA
ncbi:thiol methyltransferase [Thecamonas trahens ATCC 50062]|uniref:Thiol methyltransferase n=1 Tax=Thecamonas trahens ATCC 50062 TaxID=461836 RepID=A0A0L0DTF2_THETB|nr:thiol methyltransferase [Thecamonas trahens ATCC 50062]KNC54733.1 thiol methyltransferase [Thecamonas trahens ATCC 50062]|eukprot:XP_013761633.1 thiol methyltransferase [Thecamonas trahens ATCC 50062]